MAQRRAGYQRALSDHGLEPACFADFNLNQGGGYLQVRQLLQANPQTTALCGANDQAAVIAMQVAKDLGLSVPEDLSLVGYDDTYLAANAVPPLTTLHVDTIAMGQAAVYLLALRQENPDAARMTLLIHPTLVERETVAPPHTTP